MLLALSAGCAHSPQKETRAAEPADAVAPSLARPRPFVAPFSYEWFTRAELERARERYPEAVEAYRMALSGADEDAYLLARLAEALDLAGEVEAADRAVEQALAIEVGASEGWMARGRIAERRGDVEAALGAYERAEAAAPRSAEPPIALARLLRGQGHAERAIAVLERLAARDLSGAHHAARARLELAISRRDGAELMLAVGDALALSPPDRRALLDAAEALHASGDPAAAARVLRALPPGPLRDARYLAALLAAGEPAAAELLLLETDVAKLSRPVVWARVHLLAGDPERALSALARIEGALEGEARQLRGEALAALGRFDQAAEDLSKTSTKSGYYARARESAASALEGVGRPALAAEVRAAAR